MFEMLLEGVRRIESVAGGHAKGAVSFARAMHA